ncbi:peptide chain release factor N(5)-glutamine methyltransferase [Methylocucumis oryzae]|uniref:Release factor glutamine methyltransferase n=1 Tax=Methylocucumis oryzae TaxID=1632867 RepID=A0A0F3IPZ2_9GAMM|nr:peptide chain release factor N(5)-glutamine methyltransferase [Methylocucumis oryzae]KJV07649.1 SAM-dependent methyltransferase [Methylocucumis oryzae]
MLTVQTALTEAITLLTPCTDSPRLEAELLLAHSLVKPRSFLRAWPNADIPDADYQAFTNLLRQRQQGQPMAYILGRREFWSHDFIVTPDVLIPRPDTELLCETSLARIAKDLPLSVLDLGTGSGIIAITIAIERPYAQVYACDISPAALAIAQHNAEHHQQHIQFYQSNWFANIPIRTFDIIVSNPPYIAETDPHLQQGDLRFEPINALASGIDGLNSLRTIIADSWPYLSTNGYLILEHGYDQAPAVQTLLKNHNYQSVHTYTDLAGQPRVTLGQKIV